MRPPRLAAASLLLVAGGALSACSAPAVDHAALERWHADRAARGSDDADVTVLTSTAPSGASGGSVSTDFPEPVTPSSLVFECFGQGRISLQVAGASTRGSATTITTVGSLDCEDGPHELEPSAIGGDGVTHLEAETWGADRDTAWALYPAARSPLTR